MVEVVCPKCLEPLGGDNHICGEVITTTSSAKQSMFADQKRKRYNHDVELESKQVIVVFSIDIPKDSEFEPKWLHEQIKERMEVGESPEDYPTVEPYYIKKVW